MAEVAHWRELTGALDAAAAADGTGSLSAAVRHGGRTVWTHAAGWADREQGWRADAATVYRVGSISKTVAVTVALRLAERGLLDVDEPVARLVPEIETAVGYAGQPRVITLRDLATHTSGLAREPRIPRLLAGAADRWEETLLGAIPATRFAHPPGVCFDYSNIGAAILGLAVRRAGGMSYPELIAAEICAPLGLTATGFLPPADRERLATGYERLVDGSISTRDAERQHAGRGFRVPGGGLYSTPSEIAAFAAALGPGAEDVLLSAASRREMLRLATRKSEECSPGPSNGYGTGVELYLDGTRVLAYGHHGDLTGYGAVVLGDPEHEVTICVCSNFRGSEDLGMESSLDLLLAASGSLRALRYVFRSAPVRGFRSPS